MLHLPSGARWLSHLADVLLIVLFALMGRSTHDSGLEPVGVAWTALPFLLSYLVATVLVGLLVRGYRSWAGIWSAGVVVWAMTVAGGLALRVVFGDTAAASFQVVTTVVLGVFLLGRRALTLLILRRTRAPRP